MMQRKKKERNAPRVSFKSVKKWLHSVEARCALIFLIGAMALLVMFCAASAPAR